MEWTDTLMLDITSAANGSEPSSAMEFTRVVPLNGITLLCASSKSRSETVAALKLLRGFRATGRRVVLCDTTQLVVGKQFGTEVVEHGSASLLITCGISGREVGIGARDAGLDLGSVVVCSKATAGGQVLARQMAPGDTVLLLGLESEACDEIVGTLSDVFAPHAVAAA